MIPVMQTVFDSHTGNCLQACLASLLELGLDDVPNFMDTTIYSECEWIREYDHWLKDKFDIVSVNNEVTDDTRDAWKKWLDDKPMYTLGTANVGNLKHAVVLKGSEIVHNPWPNPSIKLTFKDIVYFEMLVPIDISKVKKLVT